MGHNPAETKARLQRKLALKKGEKKICLTMIVKNESKSMVRCLDAAKKIIDIICITDAGSTDDTVEVIKKWCNDNKIRGKVFTEPFKNFGYNRTFSAQKAKEEF